MHYECCECGKLFDSDEELQRHDCVEIECNHCGWHPNNCMCHEGPIDEMDLTMLASIRDSTGMVSKDSNEVLWFANTMARYLLGTRNEQAYSEHGELK